MNVQVPQQQTEQDLPRDDSGLARSARRFLIGGGALLLVLGGYWYYTHAAAPEGGRHRDVVAPVKVGLAEQRDMSVIERTIGTVVANSTVQVTARVQGQLTAADFKEGQMVKKGDLLFQIDPAPYQAAYDSAYASLISARGTALRSASLLKQNAIAAQTDDNNQAAFLQAKANAEAARLNLDFTKIRSPVDGKTGPILLQPGNLVSVNGITTPLVTITQIMPIKVSFALPQADLPRIQTRAHQPGGLSALIDLHDVGGKELSAPVDFISNAVNATSGTIELRATFPNTDTALVPGQLVDVVVELANIPHAVVVPREAVNIGPDGQYVYVVTPERVAQARPVTVSFDDGVNAAVVGNVHDGDKVIVDGQLRVLPGGKVTMAKMKPNPAAKAAGRRRHGNSQAAMPQNAG